MFQYDCKEIESMATVSTEQDVREHYICGRTSKNEIV